MPLACRWALTRSGFDILSYDMIIVPINISDLHWVYACIDTVTKTISYRDSLGDNDSTCTTNLARFMCDAAKQRARRVTGAEGDHPLSAWTLIAADADSPQQTDGFSCGVFVLEAIRYLVRAGLPRRSRVILTLRLVPELRRTACASTRTHSRRLRFRATSGRASSARSGRAALKRRAALLASPPPSPTRVRSLALARRRRQPH